MESLQDYSSGADSDTAANKNKIQTSAKRRRTIPASSAAAARVGGAPLEIREIAADGRIRGFPHREGQFAATVFVPVCIIAGGDVHALLASVRHILRGLKLPMCHHSPSVDIAGAQSSERAIADQASIGSAHAAIAAASPAACVANETDSSMNASALAAGWRLFGNDELHISLSRCVALKQPQLDAFLAEVKRAVSSSIRFDLHLEAGPAFFCNDQRTRTFAALPVLPASEGFDALARLIGRVDTALRAFSLPCFYEDMRPHVSIAWTNGNAAPFLAGHAALASLRAASSQLPADADFAASLPSADAAAAPVALHAIASVSVETVCVRIGQRTHSIELRAS